MQETKKNNLNDMVNRLHNPEHLFVLIEDFYKNSQKKIENDLTLEKNNNVNNFYKLEVFRATMQYLEEFVIYLVSYGEDYQDIAQKLVSFRPKRVRAFFENFLNKNTPELSRSDKRKFLKIIFAYDTIPQLELIENKISDEDIDSYVKESVDYIEKCINDFGKFYINHIELYNSIKHGNRVFLNFEIGKSDLNLKNENYVISINKGHDGKLYPLIFPIDYLVNYSMTIAKKIQGLFIYLHKIISHMLNNPQTGKLTFFKSTFDENTNQEYVKMISSDGGVVVLPKTVELDEYYSEHTVTYAYSIEMNGKNLVLHTRLNTSTNIDYPFLIPISIKPSSDLNPVLDSDFKFNFQIEDISIKQYENLIKIQKLLSNQAVSHIKIWNDNRNKEIFTSINHNLNFPQLPEYFDENVKQFLLNLEKITGNKIPMPIQLIEPQKQLINSNINKKLLKKDWNDIYQKLKDINNEIHYFIISFLIIDQNNQPNYFRVSGKLYLEIEKLFQKIFGEKDSQDKLDYFIKNLTSNVQIKKKIGLNPSLYTYLFEYFLLNPTIDNFPKFTEFCEGNFNLKIVCKHDKKRFWYQTYFIDIILSINNS